MKVWKLCIELIKEHGLFKNINADSIKNYNYYNELVVDARKIMKLPALDGTHIMCDRVETNSLLETQLSLYDAPALSYTPATLEAEKQRVIGTAKFSKYNQTTR